MQSVAYNVDCMDYMRTLPDKAFDLAISDPPYFSGPEKRGFYGQRVSSRGVKRVSYAVGWLISEVVACEQDEVEYLNMGASCAVCPFGGNLPQTGIQAREGSVRFHCGGNDEVVAPRMVSIRSDVRAGGYILSGDGIEDKEIRNLYKKWHFFIKVSRTFVGGINENNRI